MLNNWTILLLGLAVDAYADKNERRHRHSAFGWPVNAFGQYHIEGEEGRARGPVFGLRLVYTPIREDRAAFAPKKLTPRLGLRARPGFFVTQPTI
ncbi:MAG: hypothetical protein V3T41_08175 [bacterium]